MHVLIGSIKSSIYNHHQSLMKTRAEIKVGDFQTPFFLHQNVVALVHAAACIGSKKSRFT